MRFKYTFGFFLLSLLIACGGGGGGGDITVVTNQSLPAISSKASNAKILSIHPVIDQPANLQDAIAVLKIIVGLEINPGGAAITPYQAYAADYDGNGIIELSDAIGILKEIVGLTLNNIQWVLMDSLDETLAAKASLTPGAVPNIQTPIIGEIIAVMRGDVTGKNVRTVTLTEGILLIESQSTAAFDVSVFQAETDADILDSAVYR